MLCQEPGQYHLRGSSSAVRAINIGLEVLQIFVQPLLWVAEEIGNKLAKLAGRRHVLNCDGNLSLALRQLVERYLAAALDIAAVTAIPGDPLIRLELGRL